MLEWLRRLTRTDSREDKIADIELSFSWSSETTIKEPPPRPPLKPIALADTACPYCGVIQEPPPQRRKKCIDCGEVIFPKTDHETRIRYLLTRTDANRWDRKERDDRWKSLNLQVIEAYERGDFHTAEMAHFSLALMLFNEGRDHNQMARLSREDEIRHHWTTAESLGTTKIRIVAQKGDACNSCQEQNGREYTFEQALEHMPIPVRQCETRLDKNPNGGWCRCYYAPVLSVE